MHAKSSCAIGAFTVTNDITRSINAKFFSEVGKQTKMLAI
jgi:catalase